MMKGISGLLCAANMFATAVAQADTPPPDVCRTEHARCHNAGESDDNEGVCTAATCSKGSQGGQVTTYDCLKCESDAEGAVPGAAGDSTAAKTGDQKDSGGCSVRALGTEEGVATLMLGLGLLALGISRRR